MDEAVVCFRRALELKPDYADAHTNLADALREQNQFAEAVDCYSQAWKLEPDNAAVLAQLVNQLQQLCNWQDLEEKAQRVVQAVAQGNANSAATAVDPYVFLTLPLATTAEQQLLCARQWIEKMVGSQTPELRNQREAPRPAKTDRSKLTIGYLSDDFHAHPVGYFIPELIESHDRRRFTVFAYSYDPDDGSAIRRRLVNAFDRFIDIQNTSYQEAARRIRADGVDILIDLKGHTRHARTQILRLRPAPVQVNFLGYPGTIGAEFVDYIIVDDFAVPPAQQPFFTEKLVHLPGCYQVNDSKRAVAHRTPSRAECGLPARGLVFCCFNRCHKITPRIFDVWMHLLRTVEGSVLWLLQDHPATLANLRDHAQSRGVQPERLVFAPRVSLAEHLARHRLADLFLDTFPYNAHTTASDALWAGCPLVTLAGQTFPSRVAGSLLRTLGLPELITINLQEYQQLALRLALDPDYRNSLRAKLEANRTTSRLFSGERFARSLEQAFATMWAIHSAGNGPHPFEVSPTE
jgi:predicted O-linked N-acetylglucosamine transferase (SPINDLY family)